jgi:hypothetical protein
MRVYVREVEAVIPCYVCASDPEKCSHATAQYHKYLLVFAQIRDGEDILIFALDTYESKSDVDLNMLASSPYFEPATLRGTLYQEVLLGLFEYFKTEGRTSVAWDARPPKSKLNAYHFRYLPAHMKFLSLEVLTAWYEKLGFKAVERKIASQCEETDQFYLQLDSSIPAQEAVEFERSHPVKVSYLDLRRFFMNEGLSFSDERRAIYATSALLLFIDEPSCYL